MVKLIGSQGSRVVSANREPRRNKPFSGEQNRVRKKMSKNSREPSSKSTVFCGVRGFAVRTLLKEGRLWCEPSGDHHQNLKNGTGK